MILQTLSYLTPLPQPCSHYGLQVCGPPSQLVAFTCSSYLGMARALRHTPVLEQAVNSLSTFESQGWERML